MHNIVYEILAKKATWRVACRRQRILCRTTRAHIVGRDLPAKALLLSWEALVCWLFLDCTLEPVERAHGNGRVPPAGGGSGDFSEAMDAEQARAYASPFCGPAAKYRA